VSTPPLSTGQTPQSQSGIAGSLFNLTKGSAYDRDNIYAHSTDQKGHYEQMRVKVTPGIEAEIAELVASKVRGYRTPEDFVRNAIVHQLHYEMTVARPQAQVIITAEMRQSEMARHQALIQSWQATIETTMETGEALLAAGALEELGEFLTKWDQDFENQDLPIVKRNELIEVLDNLHDRLTRARRRDFK
jgi:ribosomal protein S6